MAGSLTRYHEKRDVAATREPAGAAHRPARGKALTLGLREGKAPEDVHDERPAAVEHILRETDTDDTQPHAARVAISHPGRVVLRGPDTTKLALARYYESLASHMLPHLKQRRVALLRCPEGADSTCFFQKHLAHALPRGVAEDEGDLVIESEDGLLALVQYGVIEFHTWGSQRPHSDLVDRITLDLDPDPAIAWSHLVEGAALARALIEDAGLTPFLKTTGGKGLHLVTPIKPTQSWDTVKAFAHALALRLTREAPELFTANMSKAHRHRKIFVDYLRNGHGATAIAAFSVRARHGAPVSMPISWDRLEPATDLRGDVFNVRNALQAVRAEPDPWKRYAAHRKGLVPHMVARLQR